MKILIFFYTSYYLTPSEDLCVWLVFNILNLILLLTQVCEEYKLHRETYFLSVDMYDRFMEARTGVQKEQLQLIGITCLFIASKIEVSVCMY